MAKKGDKYGCGICGLEVVCTDGCGCGVNELVCCGKLMKKKAAKKPKAKKKR
jgi:hypothetical protein